MRALLLIFLGRSVTRVIHKETDPFYKTRAWRAARQMALIRDNFMCVMCVKDVACGVRRRPRGAQMVHHIVPIKDRPDLALELDNLQSLCNDCHNKAHPEKSAAKLPEPEILRGIRVIKI